MKLQITRAYFSGIGHPDARADPLRLELTDRGGSDPADSMLILRNAGGKTSLMREIFSLLQPSAAERIGREETGGRSGNLTSYVQAADTAHVVIEWRRVEGGVCVDDMTILTGLVAEWPGGRASKSISDLSRVWYTVTGPFARASIDQLQFLEEHDRVRRRLRLAAYREQLNALSRTRGVTVDLFEGQLRWVEHLDKLGLDQVLLRYMAAMNRNEAGASAIARWRSEADFISFFIETAVDPAEIDSLDDQLDATARKVQRLPALLRQLAFEEDLHVALGPLQEAVARHREAETEHVDAIRDAETLLSEMEVRGAIEAARASEAAARAERAGKAEAQHKSEADRLDDIAGEHAKAAADFTLDGARADDRAAEAHLKEAERDVTAWALTEDLVGRDEVAAALLVAEEAAALEDDRFRPREAEREEAARGLATALHITAAVARRESGMLSERAARAAEEAVARGAERDQVLRESATLAAAAKANESLLGDVRAQREALVADGALNANDSAVDVFAREEARETTARARIDEIGGELRSLGAERRDLEQRGRIAEATLLGLERHRAETATLVETAEAERNSLAADALVLEVAGESAAIDIEALGVAIVERLADRARADDERARQEDRAVAADRRALDALVQHGLLPPPPEVELALDALARAGITHARAAAHYAAEAMREEERQRAVTLRPDLLGGIVLQREDLEAARRILEASEMIRSVPLVVGPSEELYGDHSAANTSIVLPPDASAWDASAGEAERARLSERIETVDRERERLEADAHAARDTAAQVRSHLEHYPHLDTQRALVISLISEIGRLQLAASSRAERVQQIDARTQDLERERGVQDNAARVAAERRFQLGGLVKAEAKTAGLQAKIDADREDAERLAELAEELSHDAHAARAEAERARQEARDQDRLAHQLQRDLAQLAVEPETAEAGVAFDLAALRARHAALVEALSRERSASEVYQRLERQRERVGEIKARIAKHSEAVRERAEVLRRLAESTTVDGRHAALQRAEEARDLAMEAAREANGKVYVAQGKVEELARAMAVARRPRRLRDEQMATDRLMALRYEADARRRLEAERALAETAHREQRGAQQEVDEAEEVRKALDRAKKQITPALGHDFAPNPMASAAGGNADDLEGRGGEAQARLVGADKHLREADRAWQDADDAAVAVANKPEFVSLGTENIGVYEQARKPGRAARAEQVAQLLIETANFIEIARGEIASKEQDLRFATTSLAKTVNAALSGLRTAQRSSRLPATLHGWSGEPFLKINFTRPGDDEALKTRLWPFVNEMVNAGDKRLVREKLLLKALERAVGIFRVEILKPNESFAPTYVPITELPSFSGGQRATVAIALMLMFSALREHSRSTSREASLGTLILDNPLGNANAGFLLDVQLAIARAAGIQLVYLTGITDEAAIRRFPNLVTLANSGTLRSDWRYVRIDEALRERLRPADEAGGKLSAARIAVGPE